MPAYSFQERFCPFVIDGSKPHTLRNRRKYPAKEGDKLYLYFGLRSKWVKKLREEICSDTHSVSISKEYGIMFYWRVLSKEELLIAIKHPAHISLPVDYMLSYKQANEFAWKDGFRPEGSTFKNPKGCYELMMRFWTQTHSLPWAGDLIKWNPKKTKTK